MADTILGTIAEVLSGATLSRPTGKEQTARETLRNQADRVRVPCLSVKTEGLPFGVGEYLAVAGDWWGRLVSDYAAAFLPRKSDPHEEIRFGIQGGAVVEMPAERERRPRLRGEVGAPEGGFQVRLPGWEDLVVINNEKVFDERSRRERLAAWGQQLKDSPTPPGLQELGQVLTAIDDVQDIMATAGVMLMVTERVAGRIVPGLGAVVTASDALNLFYQALSLDPKGAVRPTFRPGRGRESAALLHWRESPAGKEHKRKIAAAASARLGGMRGRLEDLRRTGRLGLGVGDLLQGLQATETLLGTGIELGAYVGYTQDAFWGLVRGARFQLPASIFDPVGLDRSGADHCYRSPRLSEVGHRAHYVLVNNALWLWSRAARVAPWVEHLDEAALQAVLVGVRQSEQVLRPWLLSGVWVEPVREMIDARPVASGFSEVFELAGRPADEVMKKAGPLAGASIRRAIEKVPDAGRQAFYSSLGVSSAWGLWGSVEPGGVLAELELAGPLADAVTLAEAGVWPERDLV